MDHTIEFVKRIDPLRRNHHGVKAPRRAPEDDKVKFLSLGLLKINNNMMIMIVRSPLI